MKRILFSSFLISYPNGQDFPCLSEEKVHFASIDPILITLVFDCLVKMDEHWNLVLLVGCVFIYRVARSAKISPANKNYRKDLLQSKYSLT